MPRTRRTVATLRDFFIIRLSYDGRRKSYGPAGGWDELRRNWFRWRSATASNGRLARLITIAAEAQKAFSPRHARLESSDRRTAQHAREIVASVLPSAVDLLGNCQGTQPDAKRHEDHAR